MPNFDLVPMSKIWKLDGTPLPEPSHFSVDSEDVHSSDSGRDQSGTMNLKVVAFGKRSVEIKYDLLPQSQMSAIMKHFHKPYYQLTYPDPEYGTRTMTCYVPARKSDLYHAVFYNGMWKDTDFSCIER